MASYHPARCRSCGKHRDEAPISKGGYCPPCGERRLTESAREIAQGYGPAHDAWVEGLLKAVNPPGRPTTPYPPDA